MSRHYFVLGGARSGKSLFAENLARDLSSEPIYLATAQVWDDEMSERVDQHKQRRASDWQLLEEPLELGKCLQENAAKNNVILVDCLTLWLTNLIISERDIADECASLVEAVSELPGSIIFVSNEVGQGIVSDNKLAREFRDHAGSLHQQIARAVDEVYFITAGLPTKLKG